MATQAATHNVLEQFVERANSLYSLPAVAMEVLELTEQTNVDTTALRQCVERDPALTAKLLRVVNSSMFGLSREVSDLKQALALLGVKPLKLLVLGFSLPQELYSGVEAEALQRFWQFTLLKAVAARELSKAFWSLAGDEAFIAGLLQEIGILVLVNELGDSYVNFLNSVHEQGEDLLALETETLGFDHAILSARLLEHWNLPTQMVQAVAVHHDADYIEGLKAEDAVLPKTLHLATLIASIIVDDRRDCMPELLDVANRYRGITVEQIDALLDQLQEQVELMADMFSVRVDRPESYRDIMSRAHRQMSEAAMDALPDLVGHTHDRPIRVEQEALHNALGQYAQNFLDLTDAVSSSSMPTEPEAASIPRRSPVVPTDLPQGNGVRQVDSSDPGLHGRLRTAITLCGARRQELSLLLMDIDNYENLLVMNGSDRMMQVVSGTVRAIESLADIPCECVIVSDVRVAVILPSCERQQAVTLARSLSEAMPVWMRQKGVSDTAFSFSTGIASLATPSRSVRSDDLIDAADRCLFAAKRSGGGGIKSIDIL